MSKSRLALITLFILTGCAPSAVQLKKTLEENPDILFNAIEKHPEEFLQSINRAVQASREKMQERHATDRQQQLEEDFKNPKKPEISADRAFFGAKEAPVTIVVYSDFQCPWCAKASATMEELLKRNKGKIKIVFKHLPLKDGSELVARYFEAIAMQGFDKAKKFHDALFAKQAKIHEGESHLQSLAKKVGADLPKVMQAIHSEKVTARLEADILEAQKFGIDGTPGFVVGGVVVHGASPAEYFQVIIDRHLAAAKEKKGSG